MKERILLTGNEAIAEGAIQAGCRFYAGYPITPQNELIAYMAKRLPEVGGVFIQAESELAAINMVYGASAAGSRAMTSSSSPGISLKQEGISYIAGAQLPAVIVNIMRGGPGLGNIMPAQSDYSQATRGGGHGDYRCLVFAPAYVEEAFHLTMLAFELADEYRNPAIILGDGMLGQMMEPIMAYGKGHTANGHHKPLAISHKPKTWALTGCKDRTPNIVKSFNLKEGDLERHNLILQKKYKAIRAGEQRWEEVSVERAEIIVVAYGSMARVAKSAIHRLKKGVKNVGLLRPITLWPFPERPFHRIVNNRRKVKFMVVEMSYGQMLDDVRLVVGSKASVEFLCRSGGGMPDEEEIINKIKRIIGR